MRPRSAVSGLLGSSSVVSVTMKPDVSHIPYTQFFCFQNEIQPRRRPRLNDGVQSGLPALGDLSIVYLNNVTIARREQPTVESETSARGFARDIQAASCAIRSGKLPTLPLQGNI